MMSKSNGFKMVYFRRSLKKYLDTNISDSHSRPSSRVINSNK